MKPIKTIDSLTVGELRAVIYSWSGDERISIAEALEYMATTTTATAEHELEQAEHQRARQDWLAGRDLAGREAQAAARAKRGATPMAGAAAREAARDAVLAYEREHPLPEGLPEAILHEQPGLVRRVVERVKGKPDQELVA